MLTSGGDGPHDRGGHGAKHRSGGDRQDQGHGQLAPSAHVVEVMGRDCGYLALVSAVAGGAEVAVVPEVELRRSHSCSS